MALASAANSRWQTRAASLHCPRACRLLRPRRRGRSTSTAIWLFKILPAVDANHLRVAYVLYLVKPDGTVGSNAGTQTLTRVPAGQSARLKTEGLNAARTKATQLKLSINSNNVSLNERNVRSRDEFGGCWVRVYGTDGSLIGESRRLSPALTKLDPPWDRGRGRGRHSCADLARWVEGTVEEAVAPRDLQGQEPRPAAFAARLSTAWKVDVILLSHSGGLCHGRA